MLNPFTYIILIIVVDLFKMNYDCCMAKEVAHDFLLSVIFAIIFHGGKFEQILYYKNS